MLLLYLNTVFFMFGWYVHCLTHEGLLTKYRFILFCRKNGIICNFEDMLQIITVLHKEVTG